MTAPTLRRRCRELRVPSCRGDVRPSSGFSLLELLLAMAMAAMLALSLYTAMTVSLRARASATASLEPTRAAMIAMDLVRHDFESIPPADDVDTLRGAFYGSHAAGGLGDNDSIEFQTIAADPVEGDAADASPLAEGIRKVELYVSDAEVGSPALVRRVTRNLLPSSEPYADEEILCHNVRSFSLRYYDGVSWLEDWDSTTLDNALPLAVAVTLELGGPDRDTPGQRVTRVVPIACAVPAADTSMMGGGF